MKGMESNSQQQGPSYSNAPENALWAGNYPQSGFCRTLQLSFSRRCRPSLRPCPQVIYTAFTRVGSTDEPVTRFHGNLFSYVAAFIMAGFFRGSSNAVSG